MANYDIGQYRFTGSGCMNEIYYSKEYQNVTISNDVTDEDTSTYFKDILITPSMGISFEANKDYYLYLKIPQDMNYEMNFTIKLVKMTQNNVPDSVEYQHIKNISLSRGGTVNNTYSVALFEDTDGSIKAMRPEPWVKNTVGRKGILYYDKDTDRYKLWQTGTDYVNTNKYNEISMAATWKEDKTDKFGTFQSVFRPLEEFDAILLQMTRTAEDYNIQTTTDDNRTEYGRKVDKDALECELYLMNNLVEEMNKAGVDKIGVWGHSEMLMAINGEEIRIGRSGYYELDAIAITSIGIVAKDGDYKNNFTIDYEYVVSTATDEEGE